jgi:hypothetical protein
LATIEAGPSLFVVEVLAETMQHASPSTQILLITTRRSSLPYQSLLNSRVDVLNLSQIPFEQLLVFDESVRRLPDLADMSQPSGKSTSQTLAVTSFSSPERASVISTGRTS